MAPAHRTAVSKSMGSSKYMQVHRRATAANCFSFSLPRASGGKSSKERVAELTAGWEEEERISDQEEGKKCYLRGDSSYLGVTYSDSNDGILPYEYYILREDEARKLRHCGDEVIRAINRGLRETLRGFGRGPDEAKIVAMFTRVKSLS
ncbi:hypothetical protein Pmar_PMAR029010 [Perkinsus marinus ATCC 50983]|uniref:Uncharacterized protein n=1 Tax=Perkinsus marinus (strain ATCC 50983 / TXsc) TaxID=423536 RepID=C5L694_PERM5|nr:hypothetical protein Pmar_PMAR029010 [Perkinsus marinus ATCC 50983]EER07721.1 hypothetical protein Pmar_PMAR029010 [Perkinsus marinus ATCC 50983]|eukprot:XP_002775905.1 hypothetical protein Pmar_PMAR029010 [Perkinsus marinus ATCC 50983]